MKHCFGQRLGKKLGLGPKDFFFISILGGSWIVYILVHLNFNLCERSPGIWLSLYLIVVADFFLKFYVRCWVINYSDFVGLRHSGYLNSPEVSGI